MHLLRTGMKNLKCQLVMRSWERYRIFYLLIKCVQKIFSKKGINLKGVAIPLSVFHSMFAPVFGAIAHQFSDLRDPAGKDRLYWYRESKSSTTPCNSAPTSRNVINSFSAFFSFLIFRIFVQSYFLQSDFSCAFDFFV